MVRTKAIDYAIDKFVNFVRVQKSNDHEGRLDAFDCFAEAVGIGAKEWEHLTDRIDDLIDNEDGSLGWAIIGVMIGLYIREFDL